MRRSEVMDAIRDAIEARRGGPLPDQWHYSPLPAELAQGEDAGFAASGWSYSIAWQSMTLPGLEGGGLSRGICDGFEGRADAVISIVYRVPIPYDEPHRAYADALDAADELIGAVAAIPLATPGRAAVPLEIGAESVRDIVTDGRYVEGVIDCRARFPLTLRKGG